MEEEKSTYKKAYDYSIRILTLRDYSEYKMRQKLKEQGHDEIVCDEVIDKLIEQNYLREEEYKRARVKGLLYKNYANSYIIQKLKSEHLEVDDEFIESLKNENDISTDSQISYLIEKKLRGKSIPEDRDLKYKLKNKILRHLISKGFDYSKSLSMLEEHLHSS